MLVTSKTVSQSQCRPPTGFKVPILQGKVNGAEQPRRASPRVL